MIRSLTLRTAPLLAGVLVAFVGSCSGPRMEILDRPVTESKAARALTNSTALDDTTRDTLRSEDLLSLYKKDGAQAIRLLAERYREEATEARRRALAEVSSDQGDRLTGAQPTVAVGYYLDAARLCEAGAIAAIGRAGESADETLYNYCASRVARIIRDHSPGRRTTMTAAGNVQRQWTLTLATGRGLVDPRDYDTLVPASWLKLKGIKWERSTQSGLGMAMLGHVERTEERHKADPMMSTSGRGTPLNASLRFSGSAASFHLQDLLTSSSAIVRGRSVPLEADYTAGLASLYYGNVVRYNKMMALLRPAALEDRAGMFSVEAYRPDKTPLVLVHGLMSSGEAWMPFINTLLGDRVIRENYQIVVFNYPSGNMIARNAADLREGLRTFREFHDPRRSHAKMRNMVIVGHSMGGIISNMQIRDSGDHLYDTIFKDDLDDLKLDAEEKAEIRELLFYKANPDIDRGIFLASPFRGSDFATGKIGNLGAWLIRLPFNIAESILTDDELLDSMTDEVRSSHLREVSWNSVRSLRPDNPTLQDVLKTKPRRGVTVHTIIARKDPKIPLKESSDGVVPYTSAVLDSAVSERIIEGEDHRSMVNAPETFEEVRRILYLHLGKRGSN